MGYRMRFNDIDEDLKVLKRDVGKVKENSFTLFGLKKTIEIVMDRYFVKDGVGLRRKVSGVDGLDSRKST